MMDWSEFDILSLFGILASVTENVVKIFLKPDNDCHKSQFINLTTDGKVEILENYIPPVTYFSGAFVGLLAAGADLLGTVGNASGTGLLLAVGIILRTYEQIQKEQAMEMHPMIRQFFGAD